MKKLVLILALIVFYQLLAAQDAFLARSFSDATISEIKSVTSGGDIAVESTEQGQQRVEVYVKPSSGDGYKSISKEKLQKKLDEYYDLVVTLSGGKLTATAKSKQHSISRQNELSISFKIFVVKNVSTDLVTSGGNIELKGVSGTEIFTTSGGNLVIEKVNGRLTGVTSGGNIQLSDAGEEIDLTTSGGDIKANNCRGTIKLSTSGGSLFLATLNGNINATTSGGDVKANDIVGTLKAATSGGNVNMFNLSCNLDAGTSGGNIKVAMNEPGQYIKVSNSGGNIELLLPKKGGYDLDLSADRISTEGLANFSGKVEKNAVKGSLNGGGTKITGSGGSGKLKLVFN